MKMKSIKIIIIFCFIANLAAKGQAKLNLNFEFSYYPSYFKNWGYMGDKSYVLRLDTVKVYAGNKSLSIACRNENISPKQYLTLYNLDSIPSFLFKNKNVVTISANVTGDSLGANSYATLYANIRGGGKFNYQQSRHFTAESPKEWKRLTITLPIYEWSNSLLFGGIVQGVGQYWFDDFEISIDGQPVRDAAFFLTPVSASEIKWLDKQLLPITRKEDSFTINKQFYKSIESVKILGLGEGSHGTHEFSLIKNQIISEIAARSKQDIIVAFESSFGAALRVNDYILHGKGDIGKILNNISNPWRTTEILELLNWIKNFNATHTNKIMFLGFDMQWLESEIENLMTYAKTYEKDLIPKVEQIQSKGSRIARMNKPSLESDSLKLEIKKIEEFFNRKKTENPDPALSLAKHSIEVISQFLDRQKNIGNRTFRDSCMASNIFWIKDNFPKHKVVLWAHNFHVKTSYKTMGTYLSGKYGDSYKALGFVTSFGTYSVFDDNSCKTLRLQVPHPETYEYWFSKQKDENWIIDLKSIDRNSKDNWMKTPRLTRIIGAFENRFEFVMADILNEYDYLIYLENTKHIKFLGLQ